jgi:predicted membrane protein
MLLLVAFLLLYLCCLCGVVAKTLLFTFENLCFFFALSCLLWRICVSVFAIIYAVHCKLIITKKCDRGASTSGYLLVRERERESEREA